MEPDVPVTLLTLACGQREIRFKFTPAAAPNRPILLIFHGQASNVLPARFESSQWNVVCPIDSFGFDGMGSWFLGESSDFFWLDAVRLIIEQVRETAGSGRLFTWGSSMGGYAALLHGTLNHADSIYANLPQTVLLGSEYSRNGAEKYFKPLFADRVDERYNDLKKLIVTRNRTKYFLCFNQLEPGHYFDEQGLIFIEHLHSLRIKTYAEIRPLSAHGLNHTISEALDLFKKYKDA